MHVSSNFKLGSLFFTQHICVCVCVFAFTAHTLFYLIGSFGSINKAVRRRWSECNILPHFVLLWWYLCSHTHTWTRPLFAHITFTGTWIIIVKGSKEHFHLFFSLQRHRSCRTMAACTWKSWSQLSCTQRPRTSPSASCPSEHSACSWLPHPESLQIL